MRIRCRPRAEPPPYRRRPWLRPDTRVGATHASHGRSREGRPGPTTSRQGLRSRRRLIGMVFLTNRKLARRTFLRGLGTTLALPFLESMLPAIGARAYAQQVLPTRFVGAFVPHGIAPGHWIPESSAAGFKYPYVYEPLEPLRKHVVLT